MELRKARVLSDQDLVWTPNDLPSCFDLNLRLAEGPLAIPSPLSCFMFSIFDSSVVGPCSGTLSFTCTGNGQHASNRGRGTYIGRLHVKTLQQMILTSVRVDVTSSSLHAWSSLWLTCRRSLLAAVPWTKEFSDFCCSRGRRLLILMLTLLWLSLSDLLTNPSEILDTGMLDRQVFSVESPTYK